MGMRNLALVRRSAIEHGAIVRNFAQFGDDCAGYVAKWLRAGASGKSYWDKHFEVTWYAKVGELPGGGTLFEPTWDVVQAKPGIGYEKISRLEALEHRDHQNATAKKAPHSRSPLLANYIQNGLKPGKPGQKKRVLELREDLESRSIADDLPREFDNSRRNGYFSFFALWADGVGGHMVGLYHDNGNARYFDPNVGELSMPFDKFTAWFRENWDNFEYRYTKLNAMHFAPVAAAPVPASQPAPPRDPRPRQAISTEQMRALGARNKSLGTK